MKKKNIIISIACSIFFIICVGATIILFPKVKEETIAYSTSIEDLFEKEGHFYVYFNRNHKVIFDYLFKSSYMPV